jgi:hypothetical protein
MDGKSAGKPAASREAVDGYVFVECWLVVREQAVEATKHLQVKTWCRFQGHLAVVEL